MSLFDAIAQAASLGYQISKDQHLTGAQREANAFTAQQNQAAMDFAAGQSRDQMLFQERMANSQWQRGVADMQAAGVNPALAYSQGGAAAPSGAAASGSAGSSVDPGRGMSMSDMLQLVALKKDLQLKDAQREEMLAAAEERRSQAAVNRVNEEWIPKEMASKIGLNEKAAANYIAGISKLEAETRGIDIANEWSPKRWQNELDNGAVNRAQTYAAIREINARINVLREQVANTQEDTRLKILQQGLVAAQASLASSQAREVNAKAWRQEFENTFTRLYGHKPDEPIWNAVTSILAETGHAMRDSVSDFGDWLKGLGQNFRNNFENLTAGMNLSFDVE